MNVNVANKLDSASKGTTLYSPIFGTVIFQYLDGDDIIVETHSMKLERFDKYGRYDRRGKQLLFPNEQTDDWSNYQLSAPYDFKPFDKVVVKDEGIWHIDFFESYDLSNKKFPYQCMASNWKYCLPFNEETAKLIGTKDDYIKESYECI